jgi:transposase
VKKISTTKIKSQVANKKVTIGMDLGDGSSRYCLLDEEGVVIGEASTPTTNAGIANVFGAMARRRVALEVGGHSPWVSRQLEAFGHEVIVANPRNVRLIGESTRKDDRLDARTLARLARIDPMLLSPVRHRGAEAQADLAVIRARRVLVSARTMLINAARGLTKSFGERLRKCGAGQVGPTLAAELNPEIRVAGGAAVGGSGGTQSAHRRLRPADRTTGERTLPGSIPAETGEGCRDTDRAHVRADSGRPEPFPAEPRRGLLHGPTTGTPKLRQE